MSSFRMWFLQGLEVDVFNGNTRTHIFTTFTGLKHLMALINLNTTGFGKYWLTTEKRGLKHKDPFYIVTTDMPKSRTHRTSTVKVQRRV